MLYTTLDNFYVTDEELNQSPSRSDGIDLDLETNLRIYGCELIQEGCILLDLPQAAAATAQVLFQRFYCKKSFKEYSVKRMATACTWVASKLEECPVSPKEVLAVFHRMFQRREGKPLLLLDPSSKVYHDKKAWLTMYERKMMRAFGFIMHVDHPHKFMISVIHQVTLDTFAEHRQEELMQEAWSLVNDSLRTTLCVRFKSEAVACGAIFMAARRLKVVLCEDPPWWSNYNVKKADMFEVCRVLTDLYQRPKAEFVPVSKDDQPVSKPATPVIPSSPEPMDATPGLGADAEQQARLAPSPLKVEHAGNAPANGADDAPVCGKPVDGGSQDGKHVDGDAAEPVSRERDAEQENDREKDKAGKREEARNVGDRERERERRDRRDRQDRGRDRERDRDRDRIKDRDRRRDREAEPSRNKDRQEDGPSKSRTRLSSAEETDGKRSPERSRERYSSKGGRAEADRDRDRDRGRDRNRDRDWKRTPLAERVDSDRERAYKRTPPLDKQFKHDRAYSDRSERRDDRREPYAERAERREPGVDRSERWEVDKADRREKTAGGERIDRGGDIDRSNRADKRYKDQESDCLEQKSDQGDYGDRKDNQPSTERGQSKEGEFDAEYEDREVDTRLEALKRKAMDSLKRKQEDGGQRKEEAGELEQEGVAGKGDDEMQVENGSAADYGGQGNNGETVRKDLHLGAGDAERSAVVDRVERKDRSKPRATPY